MGGPAPLGFGDYLRLVEQRVQALRDKPDETAYATTAALWHLAAGTRLSADAAAAQPMPDLDATGHAAMAALIERRCSGEPLAHITGRQQFLGLELLAGPEALIPRRETELLGRALVERAHAMARVGDDLVVLDVCTGSGNLALALASSVPRARVFASDLSEEAIDLARRNAMHVGLSHRVQLRVGDLLQPFDSPEFFGQVDLLSCNPPYISTQKVTGLAGEIIEFEPSLAFDGGPLGVRILNRLIREAPRYLKSGGWLVFEVGEGQGPSVSSRLATSGSFDSVVPVHDAAGAVRVVMARRL